MTSSSDALPASWQRLLALCGIVFAVLLLVGWFASGGDAPDYAAADQEWTGVGGRRALVIWSIATSIASYRAVATTARKRVATEADA